MSRARTTLVMLALAPATSGCGIGAGSSYVGQWAQRSDADYRVCVEDAARRCARTAEISALRPARSFHGTTVLFPTAGVAAVDERGHGPSIAPRMEVALQHVRGHGRFAFGGRGSFLLEPSLGGSSAKGGGSRSSTPLTALGYASIAERVAIHAGLGYSPYTRVARAGDVRTTSSVARGLVGADVLLMRRGETHLATTLELDTLLELAPFAAYRSTSLTAGLVAHF